MPKIRPSVPTVAVAALIPASVAVYAATASASPSQVTAKPAAVVAPHAVLPHAYPPPPPPTSAPPTTTPTATATVTTSPTATTTVTTSPTATTTVTATATATATSTPTKKPPVEVPVGNGDGKTHPGGKVKVHVEKHSFKPGSTVTIVITRPDGSKKTITVTAGPKGGLHYKVHVPKGAEKGHYDVKVKGHKGGHKVKGSTGFKVKKS